MVKDQLEVFELTRLAIRKLAQLSMGSGNRSDRSEVQAELAKGCEYFLRQFRGQDTQVKQDAQTVWQLLVRQRIFNYSVVALNRAAVYERRDGNFEQVVTESCKLGDRSIMMLRPSLANHVLFGCLVVFKEARLMQDLVLSAYRIPDRNVLPFFAILRRFP